MERSQPEKLKPYTLNWWIYIYDLCDLAMTHDFKRYSRLKHYVLQRIIWKYGEHKNCGNLDPACDECLEEYYEWKRSQNG